MSKKNYRNYYNEPSTEENVKIVEEPTETALDHYKVVKCSSLNFRKSPNGEILKEIPAGTVLVFVDEIFDENNVKWTQVVIADGTNEIGYVMTNYIEKL